MTMQSDLQGVESICDEASRELEAGHPARGLELLLRARGMAPRAARVHYLLGLYYADTRQVKPSLDAFDEALRLDPVNAKAHNNRGSALEQLGRLPEAEAAFRQALALDPRLAQPYVNLGHLLEQRNARDDAVALYTRAIDNGLDRQMFEQYRAAVRGVDTDASPQSWVRATFDNFAPAFDTRLRSLGYRVPEDLAELLLPTLPRGTDILDLGCGTGLCGVAFASRKGRLVGVDLSEKMLQQAKARGVYDEAVVDEAVAYLGKCAAESFDFVIAADVLVYFGALEPMFNGASRVLRPGGTFAFSTEEGERDFALLSTGRYAHSQAYVRRLAASAFSIQHANAIVVRKENGVPLAGRLYVLNRT
jgi:predicted TPR repeat methyltransferase